MRGRGRDREGAERGGEGVRLCTMKWPTLGAMVVAHSASAAVTSSASKWSTMVDSCGTTHSTKHHTAPHRQ
jgi:hypothetical protein